jgi:hypothetical protein
MQDFREFVWICDTRDPLDWAVAMQQLGAAESMRIRDASAERQRRLRRYDQQSGLVFEHFRQGVCSQVIAEIVRSKTGESDAHG